MKRTLLTTMVHSIVSTALAVGAGGCKPNPVGPYDGQCTVTLQRVGWNGEGNEPPEYQRVLAGPIRIEARPAQNAQPFDQLEILGDGCALRVEASEPSGPPWRRSVVLNVRFGSCHADLPGLPSTDVDVGSGGMGVFVHGRFDIDVAGSVFRPQGRSVVGFTCRGTRR